MTKRIKVTLQTGDVRYVLEMLKRRYPYLTPSGAANLILLEAAGIVDASGSPVTRRHPESPGGTPGDMPCPGPVRACADVCVDDVSQTILREEEKEGQAPEMNGAGRAAQLIRDLDWHGAKLPVSSNPLKLAERLVGTYPELGTDRVCQELHAASGWLEDHPTKTKKQLGSYLMKWMKNAVKGAPWEQKKQAQLPGTKQPTSGSVYVSGEGWMHYGPDGPLVPGMAPEQKEES